MTDREVITETDGKHVQWMEEAKSMQLDRLEAFIGSLINDYDHDYGTMCHAVAAAALAGAYAVENSPQGGLTGYMAGVVMWKFIEGWTGVGNLGAKLLDHEKFLFPQYKDEMASISPELFVKLQEQAETWLNEQKPAAPEVIDHWRSIADGNVPFGFTVRK